jgi:hypothetical protein
MRTFTIVAIFMTRTLALALVLLSTAAAADPLPYPKGSGQCASDYTQSGSSYWVPKNDRARAAVPKVGSCPSGWSSSGGSCQQMQRR